MTLRVNDFATFHEAVHGRAPFVWQQRLLGVIEERRQWPRVLDLPTGAGKTTCIDIAVFALALDAARPPAARWCARRIAMVVDRRIVVDQAAERGRLLLRRLNEASSGVLADVSAALRRLTGPDEEPLAVYTLRGGIAKDDGWARTPDQPLVIASTVDQFGSRLLMQGYGVSSSMKPVHAGLLGNDTLLLLDEVHLSRPFAQTLDRLAAFRTPVHHTGMRPLQFSLLSATPGDAGPDVFRLEESERRRSSPLGRRLHASKAAHLKDVVTREDLERCSAEHMAELLDRHSVVAVVVNRVLSAQAIVARLRAELGGQADIALLTGRMRPLDRDDLLTAYRDRMLAGRDRAAATRPLVVVGTQCLEAGADFDFDAIVTECASLDALRQRFGRVDRLGTYGKAEGVVIRVRDAEKDDPIYGDALPATWKWLLKQRSGKGKTVDFGIEALSPKANSNELLTPTKRAPVLLPAYLDLWMQTSPAPAVVPDVSLFLHGPDTGPADVQVIWRADLAEGHLMDRASATAIVAAIRPNSLEAVSVPFAAARRWLMLEREQDDFPDVEGSNDADRTETRAGPRALSWRGERSDVIDARSLGPGDTIIVPASRGGLRNGSFDPAARDTVSDLAERAALLARGRPLLRLNPTVLAGLALSGIGDQDDIPEAIRNQSDRPQPPWRRVWLRALNARLRHAVVELDDQVAPAAWVVVEAPRLQPAALREALQAEESVEAGADTTTDEEDSIHAGRSGITLARHCADVERLARAYASRLGVSDTIASDLALAGWLHDVGKADRRFQLLLRGGDEVDLLKDDTPWAKSRMPQGAAQAHRLAQQRSGYPRRSRHEVQSVAMLEALRTMIAPKANDIDLVLHLIGSHHGHCRPFAPAVEDPQSVTIDLSNHTSAEFGSVTFSGLSSDHRLHRLDSPVGERFWSLVERYGWFDLCGLEAILRLADHRASEEEEEEAES